HRFEDLVADADRALERDAPDQAWAQLQRALALWHGPPLAEFAYASFASAAIARLEELRLVAQELRIDAGLRLGRHAELVAELEALIAEHPLREGLRLRSEEHTSELQSLRHLVCRLLLTKQKHEELRS